MNITINFDMDGTLANLYGVENWLAYLEAEDTTPYEVAEPLLRLCSLAKRLNNLQKQGYELVTVSELIQAKHGETPQNSKIYGYSYFR